MQYQQQPTQRPDSPSDNSLHHDSVFGQYSQQNNMYNSAHIPLNYLSDHDGLGQQQQATKMNGFAPVSADVFRSSQSFTSFPNNNRPRHHTMSNGISLNTYRDTSSNFYPTSADIFTSQLNTSHIQPNSSLPFDSRGSFDYNGSQSVAHKQSFAGMVDPYGISSSSMLQSHQVGSGSVKSGPPSHSNNYGPQATYTNGIHLSSQTPYGPHIASNGPPMTNANTSVGPPPGLSVPAAINGANGPANQSTSEEISTIFVVGFPEDMQEREFQNMFTFSPGFEAATLKIPNKEYTAYGGPGSAGTGLSMGLRSGPGTTSNGYTQGYAGSNDPYNLVTVNQGGVVVDGGRDGTMASWPASVPGDDGGHFTGGNALSMPPRKQIIGFAKFKTRPEALVARDVLQGRRVDIEKGSVLKAEMAKKNLHTKRGVGPVNGMGGAGVQGGISGAASGISNLGMGGGGGMHEALAMGMNGSVMSTEASNVKEREFVALTGMGLWNPKDRDREEEERERKRERDREGVLHAMGLSGGSRGPRERAEEDERERERKRKEKETRLRSTNSSAFDAFHSVPISRQASNNNSAKQSSVFSPLDNGVDDTSPLLSNGYAHMFSQSSVAMRSTIEEPGPWDERRTTVPPFVPARPPSSQRSSSPSPNKSVPFSPTLPSDLLSGHHTSSLVQYSTQNPNSHSQYHDAQSTSSTSSVGGGSQSSSIGMGTGRAELSDESDREVSRAFGALAVSTDNGKTSPQLPSPESGSSSVSARNLIDQNPPINTLYVGNLPTSLPLPGYPQDHLEESLRDLFSSRPGYSRLCFRQKNNGPMCFVEFEDVNFATKSLNDLYGNTLNGLVKGGGIRLSYSKNPLGVRTPTSASGNGPSLQQQQQQQLQSNTVQSGSTFLPDAFQPRQPEADQARPMTILRRDSAVVSPPLSAYGSSNYMISQPPPRFSPSPSSSSTLIPNSSAFPPLSASFLPRSNKQFSGYSLQSGSGGNGTSSTFSSTFSPFSISSPPPHSTIPEHHHH